MDLLKKIVDALVIKKHKELPFIILFTFLISFVFTRIWVIAMYQGILPDMFVFVKGVHVHHLNFGIFMLSIIGFITLNYPNFTKRFLHWLAVFYAIALAWTFDEFAMWLHLEDIYWHRLSYDAIVVISAIFLNIIYFQPFWKWLLRKTRIHRTPHLVKKVFGRN